MSCLVTLHAHQCSYRYPPFDRYIHSSSFIFMLQTLGSSKSFSDLHAQFAFNSTQTGWFFLLEWLGADTHMLEDIFVVWVTSNICAFSRPLFLFAYIQMQMPYVTFTMCLSSLPCQAWGYSFSPSWLSPVLNWSAVVQVCERYFSI